MQATIRLDDGTKVTPLDHATAKTRQLLLGEDLGIPFDRTMVFTMDDLPNYNSATPVTDFLADNPNPTEDYTPFHRNGSTAPAS